VLATVTEKWMLTDPWAAISNGPAQVSVPAEADGSAIVAPDEEPVT
jgi:hypothetical protein